MNVSERMSDRSVNEKRYILEGGDRVIWRSSDNKFIKTIQARDTNSSNMYHLTDGRVVPGNQLYLIPQRLEDLELERNKDINTHNAILNDLVLFLRDNCLDIGGVIGFQEDQVHIVNLYMDDHPRWFEHGDQFDDHIPMNSNVKVVRLNKSQELDKRYL